MEKLKPNKYVVLIVILFISIGVLYFKNLDLKWQLIYEKAIPDVELINYLTFDSNNNVSGGVTGFVLFDDSKKQPRGLRQYSQIIASNSFENGKQIFYLTDIIKMNSLAPRYFDPVTLRVINASGDTITLADTENNMYMIDKSTREVSMVDATKDTTKLVTNQTDFEKYVIELLK